MNKADLVSAVMTSTGLSGAESEAALDAVLAAVVEAVATGDKVVLAGFGTFEPRHRAARGGRNPQTGEPIEIAASTTAAFKPASAFKRALVVEGDR
jgi:DNA-binding protein HU-beta